MRKITILIFVLILGLITPQVIAQNDDSYITLNLLSSFNPFNPRYRVGYIKTINSQWKLGLDVGYGTRNLSWNTNSLVTKYLTGFGGKIEDDYKLWEIRPELYYMISPQKKVKQYISTELFYIHHTDVYHNDWILSKKNEDFLVDQADYRRQKFGFHLKYGIFFYSAKRVKLNMYTGLGIRVRRNTFSDVINPNPMRDHREVAVDYNEYDGTFWRINFALGLKVLFNL